MQSKHWKNRLALLIFVLVYGGIVAFAFWGNPWKINSDFYSILPKSHELKDVVDAEKVWSSQNSSKFYVFLGHESFKEAKKTAESFCLNFQESADLRYLNCNVHEFGTENFKDFLFYYRYQLQSDRWLRSLDSGRVERVQEEALHRVYGAFSFSSLDRLEYDPFLLTENIFSDYLRSPAMSKLSFTFKEGFRVFEKEGIYYVFIDGEFSENALIMAGEGSLIGNMYEFVRGVSEKSEIRSAFSGVPFHTYESSFNAKREISLISTISIFLIIFILLWVFRSPLPILFTLSVIITSILFAASITKLVFGEIHTFTFIFGTSLIGISIDYSLHFFTHWKSKEKNKNGFDVRSKIIKQVGIGFCTTQLSYLALVLMPFLLLKQMAFFSMMGLLSSFLFIQLIFPYLPLPLPEKRNLPLKHSKVLLSFYSKIQKIPRGFNFFILIFMAIFLLIGINRVQFQNNIRSLYRMSDSLLQSEKLAAEILNHGSSGWFFMLKGNSVEDLLEREELFRKALDSLQQENLFDGYISTSSFIPSLKHQKYSYETIQKHLLDVADEQYRILELSDSAFTFFRNDFNESGLRYLNLEEIPKEMKSLVQSMWIGKVDDHYYSVILPLREKDRTLFKELAQRFESVYFVDKIQDIGNELNRYSKFSLMMISGVYLFIFFLLLKFYPLKKALLIVGVPVLAVLGTISIFGYLGYFFNFFAIAGIVLTLGIGIDYVLFFSETKKDYSVTMLAVFLSMITTVLSFGALSLSSFAPVSQFGLSVFLGIVFCFLLSPLVSKKQNKIE